MPWIVIHCGVSGHSLIRLRGRPGAVDIERVTRLPMDQLLDLTVCVGPLLDRDEVAGGRRWTCSSRSSSCRTYLRQDLTEDCIVAVFDVSQAMASRSRTALDAPIAVALADLTPGPAERTRGDMFLVDRTLIPRSD